MPASNMFCKKHGGDLSIGDEMLCDTCARNGINPCGKCGSPARIFGEAMMRTVYCESDSCHERVTTVGNPYGKEMVDIIDMWNNGTRGEINFYDDEEWEKARKENRKDWDLRRRRRIWKSLRKVRKQHVKSLKRLKRENFIDHQVCLSAWSQWKKAMLFGNN